MDLAELRRLTSTPGPHVGDLLWWSLEDARIRRPALETAWSNAGLSSSLLPEHPTAEKALKTAVREAQLGVEDHLIRLGLQTDSEIVFAVLREMRDGLGNVDHHQVARVRLDRNHTSKLEADDPGHELVRAVFEGYDRLLNTHTVDDIRRTLVKTLDTCAAVTLRDHGGVYWVPAPFTETLHRLQGAVSQIGRSKLHVVPIHATPEGTTSLGEAARNSIETEISALRLEIDAFLAEPPDRPSTLMRRLATFEDLRQRAQLYHSVLSVQVDDLDTALTDLSRQVECLLAQSAEAPTSVAA